MDFVRTLATTVVTVAVLLHPDECWAQTQQQMQAQQQHLMMSSRPPDEHFGVRGQYYDLSVGGLRDYVDTLRGDPEMYRVLDEKVSGLESQRTWAWVVGAGSVVGGLTMMLVGFPTPEREANDTLEIGGAALVVGGYCLASFVIAPGRSDLLEVVNEHNRLNDVAPIEVSMRLHRRVGGKLALRF